jgi:hypothetical protein
MRGLMICILIHYCSGDQVEKYEMGDARMGESRGVQRVLVGKSDGKRPNGRPRRRCDDNIKMDLQDVGCGGLDWIDLA